MIIYEIVCNITGERYIGSTTQKLSHRLHKHTYGAKSNHPRSNYKSKQIINRGDYQVNILEEGDIDMKREQYYIETLENINDRNAFGLNKQRIKERDKKRSPESMTKRREYSKNYKEYQRTWGGDCRTHNNLLLISLDLFE